MRARRNTVILLVSMIILTLISIFLITFKEADIAYAESDKFSGGDGRETTPYLISTADDFCALEEINTHPTLNGYFNVYFVLTADIDLNGRDIEPIGAQLYPFKGHVDGAGFCVSNISINSAAAYTGLFGAISLDASLKNITVSGEVFGNSNVGGVVGLNQGSVTGCINRASVKGAEDNTNVNVGGICGYNESIIADCYNNGNVQGFGVNTGGIVGNNAAGTVSNCFNVGTVNSGYYGAGGIAGSNEATISRCYNRSAISAYSTAGGIVGSNAVSGIIENTYNAGIITATNNMAGGICGSNDGGVYNSYNCESIAALSQKGAICGYISSSAIVDSCFSSSERFEGKLTFRGNNYPNSALLRDADLANGDTLTNANKAAALSHGRGEGVWTKRSYDDTFCYYPELIVFLNSADSTITDFSKNSAQVVRQTTEVSLDNVSFVYISKPVEPDVYRGEELLLRDVDYTVKFFNNIEIGEKDAALAEITFINYYKGSTTKAFSITKQPITVKWSEEKLYYTGKAQYPTVTVASGKKGDDNITFEYLYDSNIEVGKHSVKVQLDSLNDVNKNYSFEPESINYEILGASLVLEWSTDPLYYNGLPQYPEAKIKSGIKESDSVELIFSGYSNNINAKSDYTVKVSCSNENYSLDVTYTYQIEKRKISAVFDDKELYYTGKSQHPVISKVNNVVGDEEVEFVYKGYENNVSAQNGYTVIAELADTAINSNYLLSETIEVYEIKRQQIAVAFAEAQLFYNGCPQFPAVCVVSGVAEGEEAIFAISDYSNNINATTGNIYSITVELDSNCAVNDNYELVPVTHSYGISQAKIKVAWDENSLPLIYNNLVQHPIAVIVSEVFDEDVILSYGECNSIYAGKNYSIIVNSENENYKVDNILEYEIAPMPVVLKWKGESSFIYNGKVQCPDVEITTQTYNPIELIYGECYNLNVGQDYCVNVTCNDSNYILVNSLTYSIVPKMLNVIWSNETLIYNGLVQYPEAFADGVVENERITFIYKDCNDNFDVGIKYTVRVELDKNNLINLNYILSPSNTETSYRIGKKELPLVNIKAIDREYNGKNSVELEGGELVGIVPGDDVTFATNFAVILNPTVGENKSVEFMPTILGEHAYRYRISAPELTVNIYKARFDSSTLKFNNLAYLYDGDIKSLQLLGEIPDFIEYEISGNEQSQIGEYAVSVHFIYNQLNVEAIADMETQWYIAATEYSASDSVKVNILSGIIDYGATLGNNKIENTDEKVFSQHIKCLYGINLGFYKEDERIEYSGTVRISLSLDSEVAEQENLKLYQMINGNLAELRYQLINTNLIFVTDSLSDFYIAVEVYSDSIGIGLGISAGVLVALAVGLIILFAVLKKKKQVELGAVNTNLLSQVEERTSQQTIATAIVEQEATDLVEKEFVMDGIYCQSFQSFLASLNYKDKNKQKEVCSYSAQKANRYAAGKGNGKRRELYWQGKILKKDSSAYFELLDRARHINSE